MEVWVDTVDLEFLRKAAATSIVYGVTTYPPALVEEFGGGDFAECLRKILKLVPGPVCAHVVSTQTKDIIAEGVAASKLDSRIVVKVPCDAAGVAAMKQLSAEGITVAATAVNTLARCILAMQAGVHYVMPYTGWLDELGQNGSELVGKMRLLIDNEQSEMRIVSCVNNIAQFQSSAVPVPEFCGGRRACGVDPARWVLGTIRA
jgi:transaldolase